MSDPIETLARRLDEAAQTHIPIPPLSESENLTSVDTAYTIQTHWTAMRSARGEKVLGRKIGLTSKAIQQQLGVDQPDYGNLWDTTFYPAKDGKVEIPASDFVQPRIEGEVAFLIGKPLRKPNITRQDVLAATEACALGVRSSPAHRRWRITRRYDLPTMPLRRFHVRAVGSQPGPIGFGRARHDDPSQRRVVR
jgi:2-keto-4-pentenoate hydratase